jgi:hypothetical protein
MRAPRVKRSSLVWLLVFVVAAWLLTDRGLVPLLVAALLVALFLKIGFGLLGGLSQPLPEPPPPGELRKVKMTYRCSLCGTEVRMTTANDEMPEPPRHCMEDMDLTASVDDLL